MIARNYNIIGFIKGARLQQAVIYVAEVCDMVYITHIPEIQVIVEVL